MQWLPEDGFAGTLVGRAWVPGEGGQPRARASWPCARTACSTCREAVPTMSGLLETADPAGVVRNTRGRHIGTADSLMHNSRRRGGDGPYLLAPCDLQVIKAAGVTFAASLVERVIEEQAKGDPAQAEAIRGRGARGASAATLADDRAGLGQGAGNSRTLLVRAGPVVAVPRGGHRSRRRGVHQGAGAVGRGHRRRDRHPPRLGLEQPRARGGAGRQQPRRDRRRDARQRRQPARLRGPQRVAAGQGQGQQRVLRDRPLHPAVRRRLHARRRAPTRP